jgi:hypothetical protein
MSLRTALYTCMFAGVIALTAAILVVLPDFAKTTQTQALERAVKTRSASLALELGRRLHAEWEELGVLADQIADIEPELGRAFLEGVAGSKNVSWAGFAGTDGVVRFAANGLLEGESVAQRPWFAAGLNGNYAGDVHEAKLLQSILAPDATDPLRFIDLAHPVTDENGQVRGVLAVHIDAGWLQSYLAEAAATRGMDVFLVGPEGQVSVSTAPLDGDALSVSAIRSAGAGAAMIGEEEWPDGTTYMSVVLPEIAYQDLPSFGWRMVARIDVSDYAFTRHTIMTHGVALGLAAAGIFAIACFVFTTVFLQPMIRLTDTADRISRGETAYPEETRSTAEAAKLAASLARLSDGARTRADETTGSDLGRT